MIDFHSHILPCMDDGSHSVDETMTILKRCREQGLDAVVFTPHYYPDKEQPEAFLQRREDSVRMLSSCAVPLPIFVGAEVAFFVGISRYKNLDSLTIRGTNCILIEMPFEKWSKYEREEILSVQQRGFTPILAHVERYRQLGNKDEICFFAETDGIYLQSNAEFFLEKNTAFRAMRWIKKGYIDLLGSDCHNTSTRPPNLGEAVRLIQKKDRHGILEIMEDRGHFLLQNAEKVLGE